MKKGDEKCGRSELFNLKLENDNEWPATKFSLTSHYLRELGVLVGA